MTVPWFLIPCLVALRIEFNLVNPHRDKGADGSIGDDAHQAEPTSDHNSDSQGRVLAVDIDSSGPWDGETFNALVFNIIHACQAGIEDRIEYIIWNHHIYSRAYGYVERVYTGTSDPHTNHAHFSARHDHTGQNDTSSWNLQGDDMTDTQITKLANAIVDGIVSKLPEAIINVDAIPYTGADGTSDTWRLSTAIGYITGKTRQAVTDLDSLVATKPSV